MTPADERPAPGTTAPRPRRRAALAFGVVTLLAIGLGTLVVVQFREFNRQSLESQLAGQADVRARQLERWLHERRGDLETFVTRQALRDVVASDGLTDDYELLEERLAEAVEVLLKTYVDYTRVVVLGGETGVIWRGDEAGAPLPPALDVAWRRSLVSGAVELVDAFPSPDGGLALGLVLGLPVNTEEGRAIETGVYFEVDAARTLIPSVTEWQSVQAGAETTLARRVGDEVTYLTPLKRGAAAVRAPGTFTVSASQNPDLPAAQPVGGATRVFRGHDYAGIEVLSALSPVHGTSWLVVAKVDAEGADAPVNRLGFSLAALVLVMLATTALGWRQLHRVSRLETQNAVQRARLEEVSSRARYIAAVETSRDAYLLLGPDGAILETNGAFTALTGYTEDEARRLPLSALRADPASDQLALRQPSLLALGYVRFESAWRRKDGARIDVELTASVSPSYPGHTFVFARDLTEERARNRELATMNTLYEFTSRANRAVAQAADELSLFHEICRIAVEVGQARLAWIGRADENGDVEMLAAEGPALEYARQVHISTAPGSPDSNGPTGRALRENVHVVVEDFMASDVGAAARELALVHGLRSTAAFPLSPRGEPRAALVLHFGETGRFTPAIVALLDDLARDISFALEAFETRARAMAAEQRVLEAAATLRRLSGQLPGVVYQYRYFPDGRSCFPYASEGLQRIYEVSPDEVKQDASAVFSRLFSEDLDHVVDSIQHSMRTLTVWRDEYRVRLPVAGLRWVRGEATPERLEDGSVLWHGYIADVTEERRMTSRLKGYLDASPMPVQVIDRATFRTTYLNAAHHQLFGYTQSEVERVEDWFSRAYPDPAFRDSIGRVWEAQVDAMVPGGAAIASPDLQLRCKDGTDRWVQGISSATENELVTVWIDLTARRAAEQSTARGVERTKALLRILELGDDVDASTRVETALEEVKRLTGAASAFAFFVEGEMLKLAGTSGTWPEGAAPRAPTLVPRSEAGGWASVLASREHRIDETNTLDEAQRGLPEPLRASQRLLSLPVAERNEVNLLLHARDKSQPFTAEDVESCRLIGAELCSAIHRANAVRDLKASEGRFRGLVEQAVMGIVVVESRKITYSNARLAELFGRPVEALVGHAIDEFVVEPDRPLLSAFRDERQAGVRSQVLSLRILKPEGATIDLAVNAVSSMKDNHPVTIALVEDVTERKRAQEAIAQYALELELAMKGTVQAMSKMVDLRDPYTAGHERRVAALSTAIAAEMGWSEDRVRGMEIIGSIHDIGQISVPAEILTRPTKLTPIERRMVETHSEAGRDVLKDIKTRWPLAEAVWQHHERLDGSGYPRKLKGDEIIPEARVIAVADVIEAFCSHRPYRPAHGLDAALDEVTKHADVKYDATVVTAAVRLFREKAFKFPE